jgi:hypothetical protein
MQPDHSVRVADVFKRLMRPWPVTICGLTFFCTALQDPIHDAGYATITAQIWTVSDYDGLNVRRGALAKPEPRMIATARSAV